MEPQVSAQPGFSALRNMVTGRQGRRLRAACFGPDSADPRMSPSALQVCRVHRLPAVNVPEGAHVRRDRLERCVGGLHGNPMVGERGHQRTGNRNRKSVPCCCPRCTPHPRPGQLTPAPCQWRRSVRPSGREESWTTLPVAEPEKNCTVILAEPASVAAVIECVSAWLTDSDDPTATEAEACGGQGQTEQQAGDEGQAIPCSPRGRWPPGGCARRRHSNPRAVTRIRTPVRVVVTRQDNDTFRPSAPDDTLSS